MAEFRKKVLRVTVYIAAIIALITMIAMYAGAYPREHWELFMIGLFAGTFASAINLFIMTYFAELAVNKGKGALSAVGLLLRVIIYAGVFLGVFYICGKSGYYYGLSGGIGAAIGFLTYLLAIIWINGLYPMLRARRADRKAKRAGARGEYIYDDAPIDASGHRRYVLVRSQSFDIWRGNKHYVTHKKFRILHEIKRAKA